VTSPARPSRPQPRRPLFSSPPDLHTGTAVAKFHDKRDILLQRSRLHRDFATPLRVTDGQPISLQPCTVNKDDWSVEEPFGKPANVVPELVKHDGHAKLELGLDFLEPYLVVIDAPRYIGFAVAA
jgi:hypothetical protein